jgi:hypothetical protein
MAAAGKPTRHHPVLAMPQRGMSVRSPGEDRAAVAELVHRYALHIRRGEPALAAQLFADDGTFEVREVDPFAPDAVTVRSRAEGRDAVGAYIGNSTAGVRMIPMIHNLMVELDGDLAKATSLMMGRVWPTANEIVGEYADSVRYHGGRWAFASRIYTIWRAPAG